jgi:hypothetical protein
LIFFPALFARGVPAVSVIEREEVVRLSARHWNWLLDLMENPSKPNDPGSRWIRALVMKTLAEIRLARSPSKADIHPAQN